MTADPESSREVWGTFSVKDHLRPDAFIRELLIFDKVVVPYPRNEDERERWRRPDPNDQRVSWNPERLDDFVDLLGTQDHAGSEGTSLMWTSPWDLNRWEQRGWYADEIARLDAYGATASMLALGDDLPGVIEAVAAYPSRGAWQKETSPTPHPPQEHTAASALVALARPLLVPNIEAGKEDQALAQVIELVSDPDYRRARTAYHNWLRDFVKPLQTESDRLSDIVVDQPSVVLAGQRLGGLLSDERKTLGELLAEERRVVESSKTRRRWTRTETATIVVGTAASVAGVIAFPPAAAAAVLGTLAPTASFVGWAAGKRAQERPPEPPHTAPARPLNGASMFIMAERVGSA